MHFDGKIMVTLYTWDYEKNVNIGQAFRGNKSKGL